MDIDGHAATNKFRTLSVAILILWDGRCEGSRARVCVCVEFQSNISNLRRGQAVEESFQMR